MEDADELYNQNLTLVLNFFASKLHLYYSSSRLTLLLTVLLASETNYINTRYIPLPSRLKTADDNALSLHSVGLRYNTGNSFGKIFKDFLDSGNPLALDERKNTPSPVWPA